MSGYWWFLIVPVALGLLCFLWVAAIMCAGGRIFLRPIPPTIRVSDVLVFAGIVGAAILFVGSMVYSEGQASAPQQMDRCTALGDFAPLDVRLQCAGQATRKEPS